MNKYIGGFILLAALFLCTDVVFAQKNLSVGVVDLETLYRELPEARKANADIGALQNAYGDTLETMQKALQDKFEQYQKQKGMMPADQQKKEEESIQAMNQDLMIYKNKVQNELVAKSEAMTKPILDKILAAISQVSKDEKINLVLEKGKTGTVLYFDDNMDITYKVLDMMKRGASTTKPSGGK